ncbi:MAG: LacI family DNA-binding transcriptional regulator [Clostridia bacterium]|nr:LacI family DNA-binding transcriptional regulator [Clostridia bacterium]
MANKQQHPITAKEIAALCGVSQGTVDRALHGRGDISAETRERILRVAAEQGYSPNLSARRLVSGKSGLLGVILFDLYNEYFSELVMHMENAFREAGFLPVVMFSQKDPALEQLCIQKLCAMGVEGIVICPIGQGETLERALSATGVPVVTVGNRLNRFPHVGIDDEAAMYDMAHYVMRKGCSRALYYAPVLAHRSGNRDAQERRYAGFCRAAREFSVFYQTVTEISDIPSDVGADTVIMASTDYYALQLILAGVPAQRVTGFDNIPLLSTFGITFPTVDGGSLAVATALAEMFGTAEHPRDRIIPHRVVL